ncbi:hypothetical protein GCM10010211_48640 [Streptomyces albospinus]|uniref:Uncharacterized protein n=1 Tax=Streptomyces albospinus TaxID=285515 RepID=A0ABQ2VB32_9ACTN|nr:hypothetical protein [Streptomyces albospinus]GGU77009.1 hypothetical protein GCM10010211_48640 [Streptomyces albospinus]
MRSRSTHGAVGFNASGARFFANDTFHVVVTWGGGRAAAHMRQAQPTIHFSHEMKWAHNPEDVDPNALLDEVLQHAQLAGRPEAADHLAVQELRNQHEPLDWYPPTAMPARDRARYGLMGDAA